MTLRRGGSTVTTRVVAGAVVPTIADVAREERIDLIVLASHGCGGLDRLVLGSVATGLVQHGGVPVLILTPTALLVAQAEAPLAPDASSITEPPG
jgi:nucleotide-binding universal stress UspA family protein